MDDDSLLDAALTIWRAGVEAVKPYALFREKVSFRDGQLRVAEEHLALDAIERIVVVGAGKASGGMASGFEQLLGRHIFVDDVAHPLGGCFRSKRKATPFAVAQIIHQLGRHGFNA